MISIFQQVFELITNSPGNLVYHVVLAFSIAGALQAAFNFWRDSDFPQGRRMVFGLSLLLGTRFILFGMAVLVKLGAMESHTILPVIDRAVTAVSIVLIIWIWTFPEQTRKADAATGLLSVFIFFLFILNLVWWGINSVDFKFNETPASIGWEILILILILIGNRLLLLRRPNGWGYGLAMLSITAIGHLLQLVYPDVNSDFAGVTRFFEMASFPLLLAIPQRFNIAPIIRHEVIQAPAKESVKHKTDPKIFSQIISLTNETSELEFCKSVSKIISETLLADICLVALPPDENGRVKIICGYDLIREIHLQGLQIEGDQIPMLISAMKRSRPLMLPSSSTSLDLYNLGQILDFGKTGHLLAAFTPSADHKTPLLGYILLSPHSDRRWNREDQANLNNFANSLAPILQQNQDAENKNVELETAKHEVQSFQSLLAQVKNENAGLKAEIQKIENQTSKNQEKEVADLVAMQETTKQEINRLRAENKRLDDVIKDLAEKNLEADQPDSREDLRLALDEIALLKKQLANADKKMVEIQESVTTSAALPKDQIEVFTSIAQELRQPMSSIVGYTDLLLGESVGIIGALQRKFLDRIKASSERMDTLLDDLFQVVTLDSGEFKLQPEAVNLEDAIDKAIMDTRSQFQERSIVLRVDFPDKMPLLLADHDALQQVLIQLLKNAGTATPFDGEIFFRASIYKTEDDQDYVLMQITDQGGGIPKEDLPRVFSRLYRADNPLIQGVGDTGVGLSIVKTLVEAHNGRIWVDTEEDIGSTFSILIPLSSNQGDSQ